MEHIKYLNIRVTEEFTEAYYIYVCVYSLVIVCVWVYVSVCVYASLCMGIKREKEREKENTCSILV